MNKTDEIGHVVQVCCGPTTSWKVCKCGEMFRAAGTYEEVRAAEDAWDAEHVCEPRPAQKTFWLSFCDAKRPKGSQFLGACVIDVTAAEAEDAMMEIALRFPLAEEGAEWIGAAVRNAHALKCNPGGEVASMEIPAEHPMLRYYSHGVLMDRTTIERIDAEIEAQESGRAR